DRKEQRRFGPRECGEREERARRRGMRPSITLRCDEPPDRSHNERRRERRFEARELLHRERRGNHDQRAADECRSSFDPDGFECAIAVIAGQKKKDRPEQFRGQEWIVEQSESNRKKDGPKWRRRTC